MTRLSLQETCLLDLSGELGEKAQAQLHEQVAKYPAALLEYELLRGPYDMLRALPALPPHLATADAKRLMAERIKEGIHKTLREKERRGVAQKRWRLVYAALAGVSSIAACLVVAASVYWVRDNIALRQRMAQDVATQLQELASTEEPSQMDVAYSTVASDISNMEKSSSPTAARAVSGKEMMSLLDALDAVPKNRTGPQIDSEPPGL